MGEPLVVVKAALARPPNGCAASSTAFRIVSILGVPVVPGTVPVGAAATVEGYFGNTGTLHAVFVEVEAGKPL